MIFTSVLSFSDLGGVEEPIICLYLLRKSYVFSVDFHDIKDTWRKELDISTSNCVNKHIGRHFCRCWVFDAYHNQQLYISINLTKNMIKLNEGINQ